MKETYKYEILVNGRTVWSGINPRKKFDEICKKYPKSRIGIKWKSPKGVLIA